ncbi:LPXTG cell wall anchor domain-containing protein [Enterococcus faecalis]
MMKKILFASLFSATLLFGGSEISAFAQEIIPDDTTTPPIEVPTEPSTPEKPTDPTPPIEPPVDPVEPPITPTEPTEPTEPTTPTEPEKPVQPAEPSKPIDVVVTPTGELNHAGNGTQQPTVPIETSNLAEITHVPSVTTPITTTDGENIVAVEKGVPLTQTAEGLKPIQSSYKVLPSGNVEVKGKDGKMKVLPYTGEEMNIFLSAVGGILSVVSGFVIFKKRKAKV